MLTTLSARETNLLFGIMQDLAGIEDTADLRLRLGQRLLDLLEADHFASFVWTKSEGDTDCVALNMDERNISAYQSHFQYCDPITPSFRQCRRATHVEQIILREEFERTEFYNDFLARDGLCHGINFHAFSGTTHLGDLRIWRGRNRETFQRRDLDLLNAIGMAFANALERRRAVEDRLREADPGRKLSVWATRYGLTPREKDVLRHLGNGARDLEIADALGVSVTTVRSHIKSVFQKSGAASRAALLASLNAPAPTN
ncbi:helix-turn-helix transcriptional regulator [Rhodobacterales bacterium]|nr:helix-turn-helix transcriptional regulator [Rhodobacterales bacterium]